MVGQPKNPCTLLPQPHHLTNGGLANVSTVYRAAGRKLPATWGKQPYADAGRTHQQQRNVQRAAAASKARETGACGTNCRHRAPGQLQLQTGRPEERSCVDIDKVGEKREVMADNFLIVVYYPHPGTRKPTIFGDFRFPNYPLFDNFHCRLLLRCPVLSSHHRLSMSLPLQHHTQMLRRYH